MNELILVDRVLHCMRSLIKNTFRLLLIGLAGMALSRCADNAGSAPTLPPIILLGNDVDTAYLNTQYVTANPAAIIEVEGSRREDIRVTGSVNTTVPGTYYLDYDYSDPSGTRAATVTRTVHVVMNRFDSIHLQQAYSMFKSIGIASLWRSKSRPYQEIRIKTSTEPLIYLEHQDDSRLFLYNIHDVSHEGDTVILKTISHFGDTVCFWYFIPVNGIDGKWSKLKPMINDRRQLGQFTSATH